MNWKEVLKFCEYHRNSPEPIPAKEEEKMVGAVTTTSPSSVKGKLFNISHGKRRKKRGKEKETEY